MWGTIERLLGSSGDANVLAGEEVNALLERWSWGNGVRSVLAFGAAGVGAWGMIGGM